MPAFYSIFASVLAAIFVAVGFKWNEDYQFIKNQEKFCAIFFSHKPRNNKEQITTALVLPQYTIPESYSSTSDDRALPKSLKNCDGVAAALWDINAISPLIAVFQEKKLPPPNIIWDEDVLKEFSGDLLIHLYDYMQRNNYATLIAIGLQTNSLHEQIRIYLQKKLHSAMFYTLENNGVLIAKLVIKTSAQNQKNKTIIIAGGGNGQHTEKAGKYLKDNWIKIYDRVANEKSLPEIETLNFIAYVNDQNQITNLSPLEGHLTTISNPA